MISKWETDLIANAFRLGVSDEFKGATKDEAREVMKRLGCTLPGQDASAYCGTFMFRDSEHLAFDEFKIFFLARQKAVNEVLPLTETFVILDDLAGPNEKNVRDNKDAMARIADISSVSYSAQRSRILRSPRLTLVDS